MEAHGVDVCLLSVGPDLPWLIGYEAMPLERLTMLVVPPRRDPDPRRSPASRRPGWSRSPRSSRVRPWGETENPVAIVAELVGPAATAAIGDRTWAQFLVALQRQLPRHRLHHRRAAASVPLRAVKDPAEIEALRRAAAAIDRVVAALQAGRGARSSGAPRPRSRPSWAGASWPRATAG